MAFSLFEVTGVEIEWMIVDRATMNVAPKADLLLQAAAKLPGAVVDPEEDPNVDSNWPGGVDVGPIGWSNELTAHVVEFKTSQPVRSLATLSRDFHSAAKQANALLAPMGLLLLPGAMHPWMDPARETVLWQHAYADVYATFHKLFNCNRHGWANLQSCHINLPFASDADPMDEFGRLHAAIRMVLPILPAIAAASPVMDGVLTGMMDSRLETYRTNATRVPEATARVIPEAVFTRGEYDAKIFQPLYAALAKIEPQGTLGQEFSNARGAIARFSRGAIEIRVIDAQECPKADIAIVALTRALVRALTLGEIGPGTKVLQAFDVEALLAILQSTIRDGDHAMIVDEAYLKALGYPHATCRADELWRHLAENVLGSPVSTSSSKHAPSTDEVPSETKPTIDEILAKGCLARRLSQAIGPNLSRGRLIEVYTRLATSLETNTLFIP